MSSCNRHTKACAYVKKFDCEGCSRSFYIRDALERHKCVCTLYQQHLKTPYPTNTQMDGSCEGRAMLNIEDEILRMASGVKPDHINLSVSEVCFYLFSFGVHYSLHWVLRLASVTGVEVAKPNNGR